ncbi:MAG: cellulase family glycosylhydrolase [Anaerolineae bacterium]
MRRAIWGVLALGVLCLTAMGVALGVSVWWPHAGRAPMPAPPSATGTTEATPQAYQLTPPNVSVPAVTSTPTIALAQVVLPTGVPVVPTVAATAVPSPMPTAGQAFGVASGRCTGIVTRTGAQLTLDGRPFRFLGTNSAYFMESYFPEAEIAPALQFIGATFPNAVLRLWVLPGWDLDRLGRVLDAGAKYGVRFLITLDDYHRGKSEHWFQSTFRMEYLPHVKQVVARFRAHPAVAAWELMNEPTCGPEGFSQTCLDAEYGWVKETSEAIKALDPCRPVSVGTTGYLWGSEPDRDNFRRMHALPSVDVVSIHKQVGSAEADIVQVARDLGKPWFFGEVYYRVYDDACRPIRTEMLGERADAVAADIRESLDEGASGYLLWQYAYGAVEMGDHKEYYCGVYDYFADDPVWQVIRSVSSSLTR